MPTSMATSSSTTLGLAPASSTPKYFQIRRFVTLGVLFFGGAVATFATPEFCGKTTLELLVAGLEGPKNVVDQ